MPILENEDLTLAREALGDQSIAGDVAFTTLLSAVKAAGTQVATIQAQADEAEVALSRVQGELETVTAEKDAALSLSRSGDETKELDPVVLSMFTRSIKTQREQAITSGGITEACAKALDELLLPKGKPSPLALSRAADGAAEPFVSRLYDVLAMNSNGIKHNNPVTRDGVIVASRTAPNQSAVDADNQPPEEKPVTPERKAQLLDLVGIRA